MSEATKIALVCSACIALLLCIFSGWIGFAIGKRGREVVIQRDTVTQIEVRVDTLTQIKPEHITKTIVRKELVEVVDTIVRNDTTFIELPVERKEYGDSTYHAVVSGIRPELEEISVFPKTTTITQTITITEKEKAPRWSFSLQGGAGAQYDLIHRQFGLGPYLGAGVSWRFGK